MSPISGRKSSLVWFWGNHMSGNFMYRDGPQTAWVRKISESICIA